MSDIKLAKELEQKYKIDLRERFIVFSTNVFRYIATLPHRIEYEVFRIQISKSATSMGANYEEAQNSSLKEFAQRVKIALREGRETEYWFKVLHRMNIGDQDQLANLSKEINELCLILGKILFKVNKKISSS